MNPEQHHVTAPIETGPSEVLVRERMRATAKQLFILAGVAGAPSLLLDAFGAPQWGFWGGIGLIAGFGLFIAVLALIGGAAQLLVSFAARDATVRPAQTKPTYLRPSLALLLPGLVLWHLAMVTFQVEVAVLEEEAALLAGTLQGASVAGYGFLYVMGLAIVAAVVVMIVLALVLPRGASKPAGRLKRWLAITLLPIGIVWAVVAGASWAASLQVG